MPYEPPSAVEKGRAATAALAFVFGALSLPATAIFGFVTFAFANFYSGIDYIFVVTSCLFCPISSIFCMILAKMAVSQALESETKQRAYRLLLAAWLSVPAAALFWVVVAKVVAVHR